MRAILKYGMFEGTYEIKDPPQFIYIPKPTGVGIWSEVDYSELTEYKPNKLEFRMVVPPGYGIIPIYEFYQES